MSIESVQESGVFLLGYYQPDLDQKYYLKEEEVDEAIQKIMKWDDAILHTKIEEGIRFFTHEKGYKEMFRDGTMEEKHDLRDRVFEMVFTDMVALQHVMLERGCPTPAQYNQWN